MTQYLDRSLIRYPIISSFWHFEYFVDIFNLDNADFIKIMNRMSINFEAETNFRGGCYVAVHSLSISTSCVFG